VTSAVQITSRLFAGRPFSEVTAWLRLLVAYDIIFVTACILFFAATIEE
jgi:heme exporter protein B